MNKVIIYTDGACKPNPGIGGWGALLTIDSQMHPSHSHVQRPIYGAEPDTTNNKMELTAAIMALEALKWSCQVLMVTDSQYLQKGITVWMKNWKLQNWIGYKKPVKNKELWIRLDKAISKHCVKWNWVKAHAGHPGNEKADALANKAIKEYRS